MSTAAKVTHNKYGTSRYPATFETLSEVRIVNKMTAQRRRISKKAKNGSLKPKKTIDQLMFKIS